MRVSFEYPKSWEILNDTSELRADPVLCPPESERIATRYLYANCITFLVGARLHVPMNEMEGDNAVRMRFSREIDMKLEQPFAEYRVMTHNRLDDTAVDLTALYREGLTNMVGIWQATCADGQQLECKGVFEHVLASLEFTNDGAR